MRRDAEEKRELRAATLDLFQQQVVSQSRSPEGERSPEPKPLAVLLRRYSDKCPGNYVLLGLVEGRFPERLARFLEQPHFARVGSDTARRGIDRADDTFRQMRGKFTPQFRNGKVKDFGRPNG